MEAPSSPSSPSVLGELVRRENGSHVAFEEFETIVASVSNPLVEQKIKHTDLLPEGHPQSPSRTRQSVARYLSEAASIPDDLRPLVASAINAEPESVARRYFVTRIQVRDNSAEIQTLIDVADACL